MFAGSFVLKSSSTSTTSTCQANIYISIFLCPHSTFDTLCCRLLSKTWNTNSSSNYNCHHSIGLLSKKAKAERLIISLTYIFLLHSSLARLANLTSRCHSHIIKNISLYSDKEGRDINTSATSSHTMFLLRWILLFVAFHPSVATIREPWVENVFGFFDAKDCSAIIEAAEAIGFQTAGM